MDEKLEKALLSKSNCFFLAANVGEWIGSDGKNHKLGDRPSSDLHYYLKQIEPYKKTKKLMIELRNMFGINSSYIETYIEVMKNLVIVKEIQIEQELSRRKEKKILVRSRLL